MIDTRALSYPHPLPHTQTHTQNLNMTRMGRARWSRYQINLILRFFYLKVHVWRQIKLKCKIRPLFVVILSKLICFSQMFSQNTIIHVQIKNSSVNKFPNSRTSIHCHFLTSTLFSLKA